MNDYEIAGKVIDKAEKNGYDRLYADDNPNNFIFSHLFAKAFWSEDKVHLFTSFDHNHNPICIKCGGLKSNDGRLDCLCVPNWQYHLTRMVLCENPLQYLAKFLDEEKK